MSDEPDVGYGKPPKKTQFKPGQSGNPKGRPQRSRNLKTDLRDELRSIVNVREGGREVRVTKQRAMVKSLIARAHQGDAKAMERLVDLIERLLEPQKEHQASDPLSKEEKALLDAVAKQFGPKGQDQGEDS